MRKYQQIAELLNTSKNMVGVNGVITSLTVYDWLQVSVLWYRYIISRV